ncbi:outer membrane beta-barrel protein [Flavobacterium sp. GA093]|uniref:Outer membrane beta-barrel protein n=1 Tax=Flavobacterium hydrocarbonoxydans TaxID=2683249 RepID=A0A6I4NL70_9FLAO|nr:outer membrane beta-barrel family protein [Flavobacterium hydrocarbonoxydans]MWB93325.1 outer membrane beta-barrel protein [Flavobacterium hydrocarbonoxydans]
MRQSVLLLCCFLFLSNVLQAQKKGTVKGFVGDTINNSSLAGASISVLRAQDSILVQFTRAKENGAFELNNIKSGKFILLVSYPKYADFVDLFAVDSTQLMIDYGKINLEDKGRLLSEVIIKGNRAAMKIKGDTLEFDPKAFKIAPNAKVEDLIKQFPGIQIDKDGKITAQGETVTKVLVDGEEFFGDDPTLVTKNLRADMVDKVQLYDKKSDQAAFTGIDDGQKTKTLNVKLKEDKKNGYFGKAELGVGTDGFYKGQAMFNKFWGKKKLAAYGILGNTGQVGLGWGDKDKYGASNFQVTDDGGINFTGGANDELESWDGQFNGEGIPVAQTGGVHFDNKWNNDKESINVNYKIGDIKLSGTRNDLNQQNLSSSSIYNTSDKSFEKNMFKNKLDVAYEIKIDTTLTLKLNVDGLIKNSNTNEGEMQKGTDENGNQLNNLQQTSTNEVDDKTLNINTLLTKKLKKTGRTVSLNLNQSNTNSKSNGYLNSKAEFFSVSVITPDSTKVVDQNKVNTISNTAFKSNLTYTEPLTKSLSLLLNYGFNISNGKADRRSFNQSANGNYDILDPIFSNNYELDQTINQVGAIFNYKKNKTVLSFGSRFSGVNFKQYDVYTDTYFKQKFVNYMPQLNYQYNFKQRESLRFSYNGNTDQPTLEQIQPIRNNQNQLNTILGNPNLDPSFRNNFRGSYYSYKVLTNQYFSINGSYNFTLNPIISNVVTNDRGQSVSQFVNLNDKAATSFYLNSNFGRTIKAIDMTAGIGLSTNKNVNYNYINTKLNQTKNSSYSLNANLSKYKDKKYNFNTSFGPTYNVANASINENSNSNGWGFNGNFWTSVELPGKFEISSDGNYQYNGKTDVIPETFERFIWNATITKKFLKTDNLRVSITGRDLLNQNVGFNRSANNGNINQSTYTTIQRYFMFSVSWDFSKMGGGEIKPN